MRWAEGRERVLFERLLNPALDTPKKEVPTLQAFAPRFIEGHAIANRLKPSSIAAKKAILRLYLIPMFGRRRLDAIKNEDVQRLKAQLELKSPKTVNNVLNALSVLLKRAVEWEVIERMPCTVKLLRVQHGTAAFHDFDAYERLVEVARSIDMRTLLVVLLGGDAGLRCGEIIGARMGRRGSREAAVVRASVGLERAARDAEEWTAALRAAHATVDRGARRASAPAQQTRAVPDRRLTVHAADRAEPDDPRGEAGEREEGRPHPSSHVLFALVDARRAGASDSGARGSRGSDDDAALHAPESGGAGCGDQAARRAATRSRSGAIERQV